MVTAARIITFAFGILQSLLLLRLVLLLLIANPGNDVVGLILGVTDPFVEPFRGMFALDRVGGEPRVHLRYRRAGGPDRLDPGGGPDPDGAADLRSAARRDLRPAAI